MSRPDRQPKRPGKTIALALTWDGARWPTRALPTKARAFLAKSTPVSPAPSTRRMADLLRDDKVAELRVCWVPRLKGGREVLSGPFSTETGRRLGFKAARTVVFGDILGVVYRRRSAVVSVSTKRRMTRGRTSVAP